MNTFRLASAAALLAVAATFSACANAPTSPLDDAAQLAVDVDTAGRRPTLPWTSVLETDTTTRRPTLPWTSVRRTAAGIAP